MLKMPEDHPDHIAVFSDEVAFSLPAHRLECRAAAAAKRPVRTGPAFGPELSVQQPLFALSTPFRGIPIDISKAGRARIDQYAR
jgi:hypothetical protein